MGKKDTRVDAYIAKSKDFAKPILNHLREVVHRACPDVEETMKWSFPHFDYKGEMMFSMAAFKEHMAMGFWKGSIMKDPDKILDKDREQAMGHFGRITAMKDLPSDKILTKYIKEAMRLNDEGIKLPVKKKASEKEKKEFVVPDYFLKALSKNKAAKKVFDGFSYSKKKDYVEWLTEAKTDETRNKRMATSLEWLSEGKPRHWKYQNC